MTAQRDNASASAKEAGAGASVLNRDDIQNIFESLMNSLTTRVSSIENTLNSLNTRFSQVESVADVGGPEAQSRGVVDASHAWGANMKRTYDEYQELALVAARRSQDHYDATMTQARMHVQDVQKLVVDRLANANNNDELAVDRKWNPDEQGYQVEAILRSDTFKEGIAAAAAVAVAAAVNNREGS